MMTLLLIVQVFVSIALIVLILLQQGKGADMGAAFGAGASATIFGARGSASFMTRVTGVLATVFFVNTLALAWLSAHRDASTGASSVVQPPAVEQPSEAVPDVPAIPGLPATPAADSSAATDPSLPVGTGVPTPLAPDVPKVP